VFKRIVVGVDGRQGGRDALALATVLQRAIEGEVVAVDVHTAERAVPHADPPAETLHAAARHEQADLIVIGTSGADHHLRGDDAVATLHGAPCAVLVAPHGYAEHPHELRLIGVGYDGSRESQHALDLACRLAERADAYVRATTVVWPSSPFWPTTTRYPGWPATQVSARCRGEELLERAIAGVRDRVTPEVAVGKAWQMLASGSADLDLLIVGSRAYGPVRSVVLGSTSTHVVRQARCPVLVLPRGTTVPDDEPSARPSALRRGAARRPADAPHAPAREARIQRSRGQT
jgi:nucleotide-binding universal stress UspA family protein